MKIGVGVRLCALLWTQFHCRTHPLASQEEKYGNKKRRGGWVIWQCPAQQGSPEVDSSHQFAAAGALYGTSEKIGIKLQALRDVGAEYILRNSQRGLASLCRLSQEVLPAFADAPVLQTAV